jgi:CRP-like cAMP-binding protein
LCYTIDIMIKTDELIIQKIKKFFSDQTPILIHKGQTLYEADDPIDAIYFITEGYVRQFLVTQDGEEITMHIFQPGAYLPMMLVYSSLPNRYTFTALSQVRGFKTATAKVTTFVEKNPDVLLDLTKRFAGGINGLLLKIENELYKDAYRKVASTILYLTDKFGTTNDAETKLPFSHVQLASWTGLQRETVSRQIEKMQKKGLVHQEKNNLFIQDIQKLTEDLLS